MERQRGGIVTDTAANTVLPGRRLQAARERLGWSEADVANKLHMSVAFVRAIEADDYERLPEATFIKGYMRNYARLLEIPADEVANLFAQLVEEEPADEPEDSSPRPASGSRPWGLVIAAAVLAAALLAWLVWPEQSVESATAPALEAPQLETSQQLAPDAMSGEIGVDDGDGEAAAGLADQEAPEAEAESETLAASLDSLSMSFSGPCWVQVLDAGGETLFSGQRDADTGLTLSGAAPFRLTFGNGAAVASVSVNGEAVTLPPSTPGNVVRVRAP